MDTKARVNEDFVGCNGSLGVEIIVKCVGPEKDVADRRSGLQKGIGLGAVRLCGEGWKSALSMDMQQPLRFCFSDGSTFVT